MTEDRFAVGDTVYVWHPSEDVYGGYQACTVLEIDTHLPVCEVRIHSGGQRPVFEHQMHREKPENPRERINRLSNELFAMRAERDALAAEQERYRQALVDIFDKARTQNWSIVTLEDVLKEIAEQARRALTFRLVDAP